MDQTRHKINQRTSSGLWHVIAQLLKRNFGEGLRRLSYLGTVFALLDTLDFDFRNNFLVSEGPIDFVNPVDLIVAS